MLNNRQIEERRRGINFARFAASAVALLTLFALTGCEQDDADPFEGAADNKMQFSRIKRIKMDPSMVARRDVATGKPVAIVVQADNAAALTGVAPGGSGAFHGADYANGHSDSLGRPRGADSDYIDKAEVYWKLNWIRRHLSDAVLPDDFEKAIKICRETLTTAEHDGNYRLADDALTKLETGLKHFRAAQALHAANTETTLIPWNGGVEQAQRAIDRGALGFGEKSQTAIHVARRDDVDDASAPRRAAVSTGPTLTAAQQKSVDIVLEYARRYHASPDAMRRNDWSLAAAKINRLRDELGLMNRPENREDTYDSTNAAGASSLSGTDGVVPIPPDPNSPNSGTPGK